MFWYVVSLNIFTSYAVFWLDSRVSKYKQRALLLLHHLLYLISLFYYNHGFFSQFFKLLSFEGFEVISNQLVILEI